MLAQKRFVRLYQDFPQFLPCDYVEAVISVRIEPDENNDQPLNWAGLWFSDNLSLAGESNLTVLSDIRELPVPPITCLNLN